MTARTSKLLAIAGVFVAVALWRIYRKAGHPGWASLVPGYNLLVFMRIVGRPWWWCLLMLVPLVNIGVAILEAFELAEVFGQHDWFAYGLILLTPLFMLILGFGAARYLGPEGHSHQSEPDPVGATTP